MDLTELQEKMDAIVAKAETENRSLSDEEITEYEGLEGQLTQARKTAEVSKRNKAYTAPTIQTRTVTANAKGDEVLERAFDHYLRTGQQNSDLVELRAQGTDSNSAGGYLVPDGFRNKISERMERIGGIASVAEILNTDSGNPVSWPVNDDTANEGAITAEHDEFNGGADLTFDTRSLGAYKYTTTGAGNAPLRVSVELLQDSAFDVTDFVSRKFAQRIRKAQAKDYATGSGTNEPLGLFTTTADVTANTLTYGTLLDIVHTVDPEFRDNAKWVMNDASLKAVRGLVDGNDRPLLMDANGSLAGALPGSTMLGYGVVIDSGANVVASGVNYLAFGDIREGYIIRNVKDVTVVVNPYSRANYGEVEYVAWARSDATIQDRDAYAVVKGS